jgi:hypothetical protein
VECGFGTIWHEAAAAAECFAGQRSRDDALSAGHERLETLPRHLLRVVLVGRADPVSSMSARVKRSVSVGPGMSTVTVTPVSLSFSRSASANNCTNDFDACRPPGTSPASSPRSTR